jgi:hypothetical protein
MTANYDLPSVVEKRVRFFDGQFLQDQDFIDEQKYHLDRERRHLRMLHVAGIADGLAVSADASEPNKVTVAPGTAIDSDGRQLALAEARTVDLLPAGTFNDKQGVELYISYQESAEDVQTTKGSSDFTRWLERPELEAVAPGGAYAGATPPVLLARMALDSAGRVTVDDTVRAYSGLRLPGAAADAPTLRSTAGGRVALTGSLTVDGYIGIGTADPKRSLHVEGTEIHSGGSSAGLSFADRGVDPFVERPQGQGERWVWYASDGTARLWAGFDLLSVTSYGAVTLRSLTVEGVMEESSRVTVAGNVTVAGTITVNGLWFAENGVISSPKELTILGEPLSLKSGSSVIVRKGRGGTGNLTVEGDLQADGKLTVKGDAQAGGNLTVAGILSASGSVGIGTAKQSARLSVVGDKATELTGKALSGLLRISGGELAANLAAEVALSSIGLVVDNVDSVSLGVRAIRTTAKTTDSSGWSTTAIGLGMDVTDKPRAGAALYLHSNGNVGIGFTKPWTIPGQRLTVNGDMQVGRVTLTAEKREGDQVASSTVSCNGRLHIDGDERLYLLNTNGVIVSKAWEGNGNLTVEGTLTQSSDARLKERIRRLERPLDRLTGVRGVSYLPRQVGGRDGRSEERPAIGVLAQEVEAVFPQLVSTPGGDGYKAVDYNGLTAVLLEAVKELKTALDALRERVAALQAHA